MAAVDGGFWGPRDSEFSAAWEDPEMSKKCERYAGKTKDEAKNVGEWVDGGFRSSGELSLSVAQEDPEVAEKYERYIKKAKEEAKNGNLLKSIEYFRKADSLHPSKKLKGRIAKLEEAQQVKLQNEQDDEFVDVMGSGFALYKELYNKLYEHQKEGVAFLYSLYRDGRKGGILADDMGLGKTLQVIAFLSGMFDSELARAVLLIMPTTLISTWIKEFEKWTPGMRVTEFHGVNKKERARNLEKIQRKGGVVITTYQMLINNWQQLSTYNEREFVWDYIILDEAHKIKSSSTKTSKSCAALLAKNRVLLTGTPVQNNLREMWALFDFACQGTLLGTAKTFKMEYENPITRARERDATPGEKALGLKISENLMNIIRPYFLRRTKSDVQNKKASTQHLVSQSDIKVAEMPSLTRKNDFIIWVYLSPIQEEVYRKFISLDQIKELLMTTRSPLAELTILKKLCDHPRLLSSRACIQLGLEGDDVSAEELEPVTKFDHLSDESLIEESGKLIFLIELLHKLKDEGHRTLVFSQSRKMLDMVDRILTNRGFKIMRIDGTVSLLDREKRISLFQSHRDYSVLLLNTKVGGVGLTLTAADRVVIFDPSWNPAIDAQAVNRAYQIGQEANVVVYRFITCGTVEEKIYRRQIFKGSLIRQMTGDEKDPFRYFSKEELKELFTLDDPRMSTTQIQLHNMHASQRKTDTNLDEHVAYLSMMPIFGISDHDLIYAHEISNHEADECENEHEVHCINERVQKAQELVQMESQMRKGTEGDWLRQVAPPEKPKQRSLPSSKPATSPVIVDLTEQEMADISCHMDSLVIEDPSGDAHNRSPAPVEREFPDQLNGQVTHLDANSDVSDEHTTGDAASKLSLVGKSSPLASLIFDPLFQFHRFVGKDFQYGREPGSMSKKEASLRSKLHCDFILVLDSADEEGHGVSMGEMENVMETSVAQENGPMLVVEDSLQNMSQECNHLSHSSDGEMEKSDVQNMSEAIVDSMPRLGNSPDLGQSAKDDMNGTNSYREVQANGMDTEDEEIFHPGRRKAARRICSESETEISVFLADENESVFSPFSSPSAKGLSAPTPKIEKSMPGKLFAQSRTPMKRRSIASRSSLVHVAVEEAIDVEESIIDVNEESIIDVNEESEEEEDDEDDIFEDAVEELEITEEAAGETLPEGVSLHQRSMNPIALL